MRRISKFVVVCALAVAALVATTSAATASTGLRLASGTPLTVTARGPATLNAAGTNIICTVDLLLVINSSIAKTVGTAVGTALQRGGTITNCNAGVSGTIDADIPISYVSFGGTLPSNITTANGLASNALFTMTGGTVFGSNLCQYRGNLAVRLTGPGTSFSGGGFSGSVTTSVAGCPATARVTNAALSLYANAALGTTLTSVAIALF